MHIVQPIRSLEKIQDVKQYLLNKNKRDYFLFIFGINSALRISDILPLQVKDVKNKDHLWATESKTKKKRKILILESLKQEIYEYTKDMKENEYLFKSVRTRKPISRIQAYRILREAAAACGLEEIGTHTLRKTFGYHFYQRTKDIAELQRILNHSSPSITMRYIGIDEDTTRAAYKVFGGL
ncbi:site-specific integrase [Bacillus spizizenii]|jgi:integrase|uniref:Site-specific recombinase n=3 Tax=Bacillus spizizenii TaxID=96241 RepID=G4NWX2_BACS4|nr:MULTISPECIES: site-specific integrase [Bacillus subtilis group]APH68732.1 site-specific integrase [Bacillus subtilis]KFI01499.1 integrase [Bacillus sp. BSC154]CUB30343.1 Tyrosine recombinase XerD [Bacillus cereus]ADM38003.1 putative bacteriophage integrase [Bacillus spizizenii str. W23]AEP86840.1 site-specific recombinase [Bacillus spizizenii TU-B-10]